MTFTERLKELMGRATPGPWYLLEPPWLPSGCETTILAGSPDPHAGKFVCDFESLAADEDEQNPNAWGDAELLVYLRNHAPALLKAVENAKILVGHAEGDDLEAELNVVEALRELDSPTAGAGG